MKLSIVSFLLIAIVAGTTIVAQPAAASGGLTLGCIPGHTYSVGGYSQRVPGASVSPNSLTVGPYTVSTPGLWVGPTWVPIPFISDTTPTICPTTVIQNLVGSSASFSLLA